MTGQVLDGRRCVLIAYSGGQGILDGMPPAVRRPGSDTSPLTGSEDLTAVEYYYRVPERSVTDDVHRVDPCSQPEIGRGAMSESRMGKQESIRFVGLPGVPEGAEFTRAPSQKYRFHRRWDDEPQ